MRIGIVSDVHANVEALEACLHALDERGYDYLACLGDVVGYGAQPNECCALIRERADVTILGNHDAAVCGRMDYGYYRLIARQALDWHARHVTDENKAWLASLPYQHRVGDVAFCHGSPVNHEDFEYIFSQEQMLELVNAYPAQAPVTFIGHSHLCRAFGFSATQVTEVLRTRFHLEPDRKYLITVGSTGQPRDYDPRACAGLYDTETRAFEFLRLEYDVEQAAARILATDLSPAFGKRLLLGI